jgi:hypothetical protein
LSAESAGCEALRAERPVDEIRSLLLPARSVRQQRADNQPGKVFRRVCVYWIVF